MLVLRLEIWPYGDRFQAKEIGCIGIANDGSGDSVVANYVGIEINECGPFSTASVTNFKRVRGAWDLVFEFMKKVRSKSRKNIPAVKRGQLQEKLRSGGPSKPEIDRVYQAAIKSGEIK